MLWTGESKIALVIKYLQQEHINLTYDNLTIEGDRSYKAEAAFQSYPLHLFRFRLWKALRTGAMGVHIPFFKSILPTIHDAIVFEEAGKKLNHKLKLENRKVPRCMCGANKESIGAACPAPDCQDLKATKCAIWRIHGVRQTDDPMGTNQMNKDALTSLITGPDGPYDYDYDEHQT